MKKPVIESAPRGHELLREAGEPSHLGQCERCGVDNVAAGAPCRADDPPPPHLERAVWNDKREQTWCVEVNFDAMLPGKPIGYAALLKSSYGRFENVAWVGSPMGGELLFRGGALPGRRRSHIYFRRAFVALSAILNARLHPHVVWARDLLNALAELDAALATPGHGGRERRASARAWVTEARAGLDAAICQAEEAGRPPSPTRPTRKRPAPTVCATAQKGSPQ